ncbi:efflux RND transporter periplasmic adaptor subunit [Haliea sp. E17]|uniref:efflux RND transporter periplasmic adaptor subunit n=1 Tax=Haliea sp. E17 TaxID=3401576 RepID=UPI003AAF04A5
MTTPRISLRKFLPLLVLGGLLGLAALALLNPPAADRSRPSQGARLSVETQRLEPLSYQVMIPSYGRVRPRTESTLVSQVGGEVIWVSPQFRDGGIFRAGETLLRIDDRDYQADVQIARAQLFEAQQALAEEAAQSQQALADWQRLGDGSDADALVLRKPQLLAAQARVASAEAQLAKAQLQLDRTSIIAPFAGRILSTEVDLGEVINANSQLGEMYATDYVEIRLPVANADLPFIDLPEPDSAGDTAVPPPRVPVAIHSSLSRDSRWEGFLVRTEGAIDDTSRQLHVIAQVDDPFELLASAAAAPASRKPLKIGEYVTAEIAGTTLEEALVIPNSTIYQGSYVYVVEEGLLQRRSVEVAWRNDIDAVVAAGLQAGDELVLTALGQVTSGTRVQVAGAAPLERAAQLDPDGAGRPDSTGEKAGPPAGDGPPPGAQGKWGGPRS